MLSPSLALAPLVTRAVSRHGGPGPPSGRARVLTPATVLHIVTPLLCSHWLIPLGLSQMPFVHTAPVGAARLLKWAWSGNPSPPPTEVSSSFQAQAQSGDSFMQFLAAGRWKKGCPTISFVGRHTSSRWEETGCLSDTVPCSPQSPRLQSSTAVPPWLPPGGREMGWATSHPEWASEVSLHAREKAQGLVRQPLCCLAFLKRALYKMYNNSPQLILKCFLLTAY